jgi:RHS repeat-associated protein
MLTSASYQSGGSSVPYLSWRFDAVGTLSRVTFANGTSMRSLASARQLRQVDQHSAAVSNSFLQTVMQQSFDANGSVTQKVTGQGNLSLTWDARNRLTTASTTGANAVSESYRYDGLGRRIAKTSAGITTNYLYDGEDIVAEYTGSNWSTPSVRYVHGAGTDEVLARIAYVNGIAQAGEYYAADGLGSVVALARGDGSGLEGTLRDAWGRSVYTAPGGALPLGYGYTGREQDATGLVYYRARYYDAAFGGIQSGQFVSRDPTGLAGGINEYAYVGNNPVNATDPGGMVARRVSNAATQSLSYAGNFAVPAARAEDNGTGWSTPTWTTHSEGFDPPGPVGDDHLVFSPVRLPEPGSAVVPIPGFNSAASVGGRLGGTAHRGTVAIRAGELERQGHTVTAGGGRLPERSVITPEGKRRFPDISTRGPNGIPYHENVGRSTVGGDAIARERRALDDIRRATGTEPGYTPYDR